MSQDLAVCLAYLIFSIFIFYVSTVVVLKGMVESCLLSKDELLTPNIDEVVVSSLNF